MKRRWLAELVIPVLVLALSVSCKRSSGYEAEGDGGSDSSVGRDASDVDGDADGDGDGDADGDGDLDTDIDGDSDSDGDADADTDAGCKLESYQQCQDGEIYWFDSCGDKGTLAAGCPDENAECVNISSTAAECRCLDHWAGDDCDVCKPGWAEADCSTCVRYVNVNAASSSPDGLTWATAFARVQDGLDSAYTFIDSGVLDAGVDGGSDAGADLSCEVWVARGRYPVYENSREDTVHLRAGVGLYGGFAGDETSRDSRDVEKNLTILDGRGVTHDFDAGADSGPDAGIPIQVFHVVTGSDNTVLDGFTVTGGRADQTDTRNGEGAGMINDQGSSYIFHCWFVDNYAQKGAGLFNQGFSRIVQSYFSGNKATLAGGGIASHAGSRTEIRSSVIAANDASEGGGIFNNYQSRVDVMNSVLIGNGNAAVYNAADSDVSVENCTIFWNIRGILTFEINHVSIMNTIFRNDTEDEIKTLLSRQISVVSSDISGGYPGEGNIDADPVFLSDPLTTGHWSHVEFNPDEFRTELEQSSQTWTPDSLSKMYVMPDSESIKSFVIRGNSESTIYLPGDMTRFMKAGDVFHIYDLHLSSGSPCIDKASDGDAPLEDLEGDSRYDMPGSGTSVADMGAYEYHP